MYIHVHVFDVKVTLYMYIYENLKYGTHTYGNTLLLNEIKYKKCFEVYMYMYIHVYTCKCIYILK